MSTSLVKIYKKFLSKDECEELNDIARQGVIDGWIRQGVQSGDNNYNLRLTSRMHMRNHEYPDKVREISLRIRQFLNLEREPLIVGHGKDGTVVSYTMQGGSVYRHHDPRSIDGKGTYRCNILTQANEDGGQLFVSPNRTNIRGTDFEQYDDGQHIALEVGDLHCYMVSELDHWVTPANGPSPRIMWMFGAHVPI